MTVSVFSSICANVGFEKKRNGDSAAAQYTQKKVKFFPPLFQLFCAVLSSIDFGFQVTLTALDLIIM